MIKYLKVAALAAVVGVGSYWTGKYQGATQVTTAIKDNFLPSIFGDDTDMEDIVQRPSNPATAADMHAKLAIAAAKKQYRLGIVVYPVFNDTDKVKYIALFGRNLFKDFWLEATYDFHTKSIGIGISYEF